MDNLSSLTDFYFVLGVAGGFSSGDYGGSSGGYSAGNAGGQRYPY